MPVDPNISLQAGRPPGAGEAGGGLLSNNLLADPSKLNTLMQMGGNMAAGRAVNSAAGPDGNIDIGTAIKNLTADPLTAPVALEALGKIQSIANAQYSRTKAQNDEAKGILSGLMALGDGITKEDYAGAIKSGYERGLIPAPLAATLSSQMPMRPTGEFDPKGAANNVTQMFLQRLSGPELSSVVNGDPHTFSNGAYTTTVMLPKLPGLSARVITQQEQQLGPAERQTLQPDNVNDTPGPKFGAQNFTPVGAKPQVPAPPPAPIAPGGAKPAAPTTGRYPVSKGVAAFLAAPNADAARAVVSKMSAEDKTALQKYLSAKRGQ